MDLFTTSGTSPTDAETLALLLLLVADVIAWFALVKLLQHATGRRSPRLRPRWTERREPGLALVYSGARPATIRKRRQP